MTSGAKSSVIDEIYRRLERFEQEYRIETLQQRLGG